MKSKQTCALIKDLLALYVEKLTSEETNQIITSHLEECSSCRRTYNTMNDDIPMEAAKDERDKEVDYLKKIRVSTRMKVIMAIAGVICTVGIFIFIKLFIYGSPTEGYVANVSIENNQIVVNGTFQDSASVYSHHKVVKQNGQTKMVIYAVLPTFWNHSGEFKIQCSIDEAQEQGLVIANEKVTTSGTVISSYAAEIYKNKNKYIGDMSKNSRLAYALGIGKNLGSFKNELQTSKEPYGWTLQYETCLEESNETLFNETMKGYAYVLLATVENVGEIQWTYNLRTDSKIEEKSVTVTKQDADHEFGVDIKSFGASEEGIEELLIKTGINKGI